MEKETVMAAGSKKKEEDKVEFSATVQARRDRLEVEVGDASQESLGKTYGVTPDAKKDK